MEDETRHPAATTRVESPRRGLTSERWLAGVALVGVLASAASAALLPLVSEYGFVGDQISELVLGRFGFVQTAAFFAGGLGTLALTVGLRRTTKGAWGSLAGSVLVGLYGVGTILAGCFPTDPVEGAVDFSALSTVGLIHIIAAFVSFVCVTAGMFVLSRTFKREARWRGFWRVSLVLAFCALAGFFLPSAGPLVGLYQRVFVGTMILWVILSSLKLLSIART